MTVLNASGICVFYGGVKALVDVDVKVEEGQLVGLIGPNGAGKTTFIDAITGFTRSEGRVELDGQDLTSAPPHVRARRGLARTWQSIELFDDLTVRENLSVAANHASAWGSFRETLSGPAGADAATEKALAAVGLDGMADAMATDLSHGRRKLVGVARALSANPRVILLDEPAAGLDSQESLALGRRLRSIVDAGTSMLLIDHDMGLVMAVCDYLYVLNFGKLIAEGTPEQVRGESRVIEAYLGGSAVAERALDSTGGLDVSDGFASSSDDPGGVAGPSQTVPAEAK